MNSFLDHGKVDLVDQVDQGRVDQNLKAPGFYWEKTWAGSLVRIGLRPPKPVVVGSNPTPPATLTFPVSLEEFSGLFSKYKGFS